MDEKVEEIKNSVGAIAEMALVFMRAAIGAGATQREATQLAQAYMAAMIFGAADRQQAEGE